MYKTVSVFIPAYNEEKNIKKILEQTLMQKRGNFTLEKILVFIDGATDYTVHEVRRINSCLIEVIEQKERSGKWFGFKMAQDRITSDICICIDADIEINDNSVFEALVKETEKAELVSIRQMPAPAENNVQRIISTGLRFSVDLFEENRPQTDISLANGRCMALKRDLFQKMFFQKTFGYDVYIYICTKKLHMNFSYINDHQIIFTCPKTLPDYIRQSTRASFIPQKMRELFGEYADIHLKKIPTLSILRKMIVYLKRSPIDFSLYITFKTLATLSKLVQKMPSDKWVIAKSTK